MITLTVQGKDLDDVMKQVGRLAVEMNVGPKEPTGPKGNTHELSEYDRQRQLSFPLETGSPCRDESAPTESPSPKKSKKADGRSVDPVNSAPKVAEVETDKKRKADRATSGVDDKDTSQISKDEIANTLRSLNASKGIQAAKKALSQFKVSRIAELPETAYLDFSRVCSEMMSAKA